MSRDWRGLAALDNLDEIERRVRNLFADPCRSWTRIDLYESRSVSAAPSIKPGLALAGEYGGEVKREGDSLFVSLGFADGFGISTEHATEDDARRAHAIDRGHGDDQEYTWVSIKGGATPEPGADDRISITNRNTHGSVRHVILVPEGGEDPYLLAEREARVLDVLAARMAAEEATVGGEYIDAEFVARLAARIRSDHYPLTWEKP